MQNRTAKISRMRSQAQAGARLALHQFRNNVDFTLNRVLRKAISLHVSDQLNEQIRHTARLDVEGGQGGGQFSGEGKIVVADDTQLLRDAQSRLSSRLVASQCHPIRGKDDPSGTIGRGKSRRQRLAGTVFVGGLERKLDAPFRMQRKPELFQGRKEPFAQIRGVHLDLRAGHQSQAFVPQGRQILHGAKSRLADIDQNGDLPGKFGLVMEQDGRNSNFMDDPKGGNSP
jgi:hypothetical protein